MNDTSPSREMLIADRMRKLEGTLAAYDAMINTDAVDRLRKRNAELERTLLDMLGAGNLTEKQQAALTLILKNKFHSIY